MPLTPLYHRRAQLHVESFYVAAQEMLYQARIAKQEDRLDADRKSVV